MTYVLNPTTEEWIEFYREIRKWRELLPHEQKELDRYVAKLKSTQLERKRGKRYRQKHKEEIAKKQSEFLKTEAGKAKSARAFKRAYEKDPDKFKRRYQEWKKNNPELYQAQLDRKNAKRQAAAKAKREAEGKQCA